MGERVFRVFFSADRLDKNSVVDQAAQNRGRDSDGHVRRLIEDLCATTLHGEDYGLMQGTVFGVQAVRWGSGFEKIRPSWEEFDICDIYLGCEQ